jgi:putative YhbY family RNA-binding protein
MISLTPTQRRELRARAHPLHPVVAIGHGGLTPAVLREVDIALNAHELVKVRAHTDDRDEREAHLAAICEALAAAPVQHLGKLLIVWRPAPKKEPLARAKTPAKRGRDPRAKPGDRRRTRDESDKGRARKHLRGSARHDKPPLATIDAPRPPRRRPGAEGVEPFVPATTASRGKRYVGGQAVVPGTQRPPSRRRRTDAEAADGAADRRPPRPAGKRPPAEGKRPSAAGKRPPAEGKRPSAAGKRPPAGKKRPPAGGKRPPAAVQRRRRPTGRG